MGVLASDVIERLKDHDVVRGETWTVIVRKDNDRWWAHVLWCGEGFVQIGFPNRELAEQWAAITLEACEAGQVEE